MANDSLLIHTSTAVTSTCISHDLPKYLLTKSIKYQLHKQMIMWVENCLDSWAPRLVISYMNSSWQTLINGIPPGSILAPMPSTASINGLHDEAEHIVSKWTDDTKRQGIPPTLQRIKAIQSACNSQKPQSPTEANVQCCYLWQSSPRNTMWPTRQRAALQKFLWGAGQWRIKHDSTVNPRSKEYPRYRYNSIPNCFSNLQLAGWGKA